MQDDIAELRASDVLDGARLAEFEKRRRLLWPSMIQLDNSARLLATLRDEYPGRLLSAGGFPLNLLLWHAHENVNVVAHRVWDDNDGRAAPLRKLGGFVKRHAKPEYHPMIRQRLRRAEPSDRAKAALEQIKPIRGQYLAHVDFNQNPDAAFASIAELELIARELTAYFNAAGFGETHTFQVDRMLPRADDTTEVHDLFDPIALRCELSRGFDEGRPWVELLRPKYTQQEVDALNKIRTRHGLPSIP
jgi:hypothetical protein